MVRCSHACVCVCKNISPLCSHFILSFSFVPPGSPPPEITWSKLRAPLPWKHTVIDGVLTLNNVGRQDSGQYICNATNVHGYSEAYTQMEVESKSTTQMTNADIVQPDSLSPLMTRVFCLLLPCSSSVCHLPARPGEAPARRCPTCAVPCPRLSSHSARVEPGGQGEPASGSRDHKGREAAHSPRQAERQRNIQMCGHQPHRLQ